MDVIIFVTNFLFTFVVASDVLFLFLASLYKYDDIKHHQLLFLLTRPLGPVVIGFLFYLLLWLCPRLPKDFYLFSVALPFLVAILAYRKHIPKLIGCYKSLGNTLRNYICSDAAKDWKNLFVVFIFFAIFLVGIGSPITNHDTLVHAIEAKIIVRELDVSAYPLQIKDPISGFFYSSFQVPGMQSIYGWFFLVNGNTFGDYLVRSFAPICSLYILFAVLHLAGLLGRSTKIWATLILMTVPLIVVSSYDNYQDMIRLCLMLVAIISFNELLQEKSKANVILTGICLGFSMFVHLLSAVVVFSIFTYLFIFSGWSWKDKFNKSVYLILLTVLLSGASHYLQPYILEKLYRSFRLDYIRELYLYATSETWFELSSNDLEKVKEKLSQDEIGKMNALLGKKFKNREEFENELSKIIPPEGKEVINEIGQFSKRRYQLELPEEPKEVSFVVSGRGQDTQLMKWLFGRLQVFFRLEYFGFVFYLGLLGMFFCWRDGLLKTKLNKLLVWTSLVYFVVVVSGVYKSSWSNHRYIGTIIPIMACFGGYFMDRFLLWQREKKRFTLKKTVVLTLIVSPLVVCLTILGMKVGITNSGSFYKDFYKPDWVIHASSNPFSALHSFWENYVGIRKTLKYLFSDQETKLANSHDSLAVILHFKKTAPPDAKALVFREGKYFYYSGRFGQPWFEQPFYRELSCYKSPELAVEYLLTRGIEYIIIDTGRENTPAFQNTEIKNIIADPALSELVYRYGIASIYKLKEKHFYEVP